MPPGRRQPLQAREMPLPAVREELPRGQGILERDPGHRVRAGNATLPGLVSPSDLYIPRSRCPFSLIMASGPCRVQGRTARGRVG
jgi:hypothetical protein